MAKKQGGRPAGKRGPYKTESDVSDPDQLGTGWIKVRQHRLAKPWTVEMLAEVAEMSQGTISGIEGGKVGYSHQTLIKLANALGTTVGALFDVDPRGGKGGEIYPLWGRASPSQRQRIIAYTKGMLGEDD
jgi:transcriptional regulator with XRE-family HTH domain